MHFQATKNSKDEIQVNRTVAKNPIQRIYKFFCHDITLSNIKPVEKNPPKPGKMWKYLKNIEILPKKAKYLNFKKKAKIFKINILYIF